MIYDSAVIGAGVTGAAIARELAAYEGRFCVIEKSEDVCTGTSKANSAIIHAGFDAKPGSVMAKMNVEGNMLMDETARDLDIPFRRNGAMVLCFDAGDTEKLRELYDRGVKNGVKGIKILNREEARIIEPALSDNVTAALYAPASGIVCPFEMTLGFAENAADNGVEFFFDSKVKSIEKSGDIYRINAGGRVIEARTVVNCAGLYADSIHNMVCSDKIEIKPRRGEYILCDKTSGSLVNSTLFQLPTKYGKGVLVTPTIHGNLLMGPTAEDIDSKEGQDTTAQGLDDVIQKAGLSVKTLPSRQAITSFSGLRAHTDAGEFILGESSEENFFDAAGIESPGLSSAPAIGKHMAAQVAEKLGLKKNEKFNPVRRGIIDPMKLDFARRKEFIEENPHYGRIICRCEMVSEGQILSAIHRTLGAKTLDGVKRRTRAGMGRCQAGFCSPKVMEILSREMGVSMDKIRKNGEDSYIVVGKTGKGGDDR